MQSTQWVRFVASLALLALLVPTARTVLAQESEEADEDEDIEEVVVTGSRIKRTDFSSPSPLTVIDGQSILESGFGNIGETLRQTAAAGTAGFNQSSVLSGGGATSVDLRNLGPNRLLILVNGKRVASFADSLANQAVDLTFVPSAMVERVDILRDGASAVYGADAVSGVVNVILKDNFEGIEAGVSSGISGQRDGHQYTAEFALGSTSDRGSVILGGEYRYFNNVPQIDRDWAFPAISSLSGTAQNGSFFSTGGVFFADNGALFCTQPKALGGNERMNVSPNCVSFAPRQEVSDPGEVELVRYDYALGQDIWGQSEVYATAGYGVYDLTDTVEVFMESQYSKRRSVFRLDGNPGSFGTPLVPEGWRIPATNPNNPTGSAGSYYVRPTTTIGARVSTHESDTSRVVIGARGDIVTDNRFNNWSWELSHLYTRVDANLRTNSTWNLLRANIISDPDRCAADSVCSAIVNPSGALDALRPGNWTYDEILYLRQNSLARSEFQTTGWFGLLTGPFFTLPAGDIHVAVGFEYRTDRGFSKPDSVTEAGESVANQVFTTEGSFSLSETFGEVDVPLLADLPLVESLDVNFQARRSDYSTFGSESVWRAGVNWQIIQDVRMRSTVSTAYRGPQVTDLFGGGTVSFDFFTHPCADGDPDRQPGNNVDQNCLLDGIPAGVSQVSSQFAVLAGSNPNLAPETADTWTAGFVLTPRFLDGFSASVDLWDIEVENLITRFTSDSVVDGCYSGPVGLTDENCARFTSVVGTAGLSLRGLVNQLINSDSVATKGVDLGLRYETDGPMDTYIVADFNATYVTENTFAPRAGNADDRGSMPRIRGIGNVRVDKGQFDFLWRLRYIDGMNDPRYDGDNAFGYSNVPYHLEHDIRVGWNPGQYRILFGVNDLLDNDPPYVFSSGNNTDLFLYSAMGRYYFLRANISM